MPEKFPSADNTSIDAAQQRGVPEKERDNEPAESPADRIVREETNKLMPEMRRFVTRGLGDLFELLPKQGETKKEEVINLIAHTDLASMLPAMREKFANEMIRKKVNQAKDKADFIGKSLDTDAIKMFMHLEAMKGSTEAALARLREEREAHQGQKAEDRTTKDAARLAELREEILGSSDDTSSSV